MDSGIRSGEKGALDGCGASGVATQAIDFRRNSEGMPPPDDGAAILVVSRLGCRQEEACVTQTGNHCRAPWQFGAEGELRPLDWKLA